MKKCEQTHIYYCMAKNNVISNLQGNFHKIKFTQFCFYVISNIIFKGWLDDTNTTPSAMPIAVHIQFYMISDHVKLSIRWQQGNGSGSNPPPS